MKRALAFGCHPDDVEFSCAGTLALLAQRGWEIHIATMTGGEMGSTTLPPQQMKAVRLKECEKSASVLDAKYHYAGGRDVEVEYNAQLRQNVTAIVRDVEPSLVFTHPPMDYMIDHEETSRLVRNAVFVAPIPNYDCGSPARPTAKVPHLYYWNAAGEKDLFGRPLPINRIVDITSVMETKRQMLACHISQREWLAYISGMDEYLLSMAASAERQGRLVGVQAGEGFVQHLGSSYPQDDLLKSILGNLCHEV